MTNTYLIKSKVDLIKEAKQDFLELYGSQISPFSRKIYFYFFIDKNKKFVHKKSLQFVYTNGDTFSTDLHPDFCRLEKLVEVPDIFGFLRTDESGLLPNLLEENEKFFVFDYVLGELVDHINMKEFFELKEFHYKIALTPFYNSMTFNLIRTETGIKLIDLKHFEKRDLRPFYVYFYNRQLGINRLYLEEKTQLEEVAKYLEIDYPVRDAVIVKY